MYVYIICIQSWHIQNKSYLSRKLSNVLRSNFFGEWGLKYFCFYYSRPKPNHVACIPISTRIDWGRFKGLVLYTWIETESPDAFRVYDIAIISRSCPISLQYKGQNMLKIQLKWKDGNRWTVNKRCPNWIVLRTCAFAETNVPKRNLNFFSS